MDLPAFPAAHPALIPPGTVIGDWRVEDWAGRGVYGAVYRATPLRAGPAVPVALKMALLPEDPRFLREVELLSRCDHPSIPRLLGQGSWQSPSGTVHPFYVMQWVEGVRLYAQARRQPVTAEQVRRWLSQLASALAVLHAQGAVHRDLKGDNVLVRRADGRAVLMDFGTCSYPGAATLTPPLVFPGTPAYRAPESWLFELQFERDAMARYRAAPADDLYALGVTACRLLTGEYPEPANAFRDEHGTWHFKQVVTPPGFEEDSRVEPSLRAVVLRLLSLRPEQRGTAAQLAAEQGQATKPHVPERRKSLARRRWPWAALAAASGGLALCAGPDASREWLEKVTLACIASAGGGSPSTKTRGLAEEAAATSTEPAPAASPPDGIAEDTPPKPVPGQTRPDGKGLCPRKWQISLNGACWVRFAHESEACDLLNGQMFKGLCYMPVLLPPGRSPTSSPAKNP
jgi:hypothetical protein